MPHLTYRDDHSSLTEVSGEVELLCTRRPFPDDNGIIGLNVDSVVLVRLGEAVQTTVRLVYPLDPVLDEAVSGKVGKLNRDLAEGHRGILTCVGFRARAALSSRPV